MVMIKKRTVEKIETNLISSARILHILTNLDLGGAEISVVAICQCLHKRGIDVRLAYSSRGGESGGYHPVLIKRLNESGIPTYDVPQMVRNVSLFRDIRALCRLCAVIRAVKPDIVHTHMSKAGLLGRAASVIMGVPHIIHTVRGWSFYSTDSRLKRYFYVLLERLAAHYTDKMFCVSTQQINDGLRAKIGHHGDYVLVHSGIPIAQFRPGGEDCGNLRSEIGIPANVQVVGTVMGLCRQKAPLDFVAASEIICHNYDKVHFLIVGDGPLRKDMADAISRKKMSDRCHLLGFRLDIPQLLSLMDVFLLTSYWEGLPRVLMEAIVARVPIVSTNVGGVSEVVRHGVSGFLTFAGDIKGLADYVIRLLRDPCTRKRMADKAESGIDDSFDLDFVVQYHEEFYCKLLQSPGLFLK